MNPFDISSVIIELPAYAYVLPSPLPAPLPLPILEATPPEEPAPTADITPPEINFLSSLNQTFNQSSVQFVFTVNEPCNWTGYSLDGKENVTFTGNFTLTDLSKGLHNLTVYANDTLGNMGASETLNFTIAVTEPEAESFPTVPVAAASAGSIAAVTSVGLLFHFRKRRHKER
jgi:hypothetical protein